MSGLPARGAGIGYQHDAHGSSRRQRRKADRNGKRCRQNVYRAARRKAGAAYFPVAERFDKHPAKQRADPGIF